MSGDAARPRARPLCRSPRTRGSDPRDRRGPQRPCLPVPPRWSERGHGPPASPRRAPHRQPRPGCDAPARRRRDRDQVPDPVEEAPSVQEHRVAQGRRGRAAGQPTDTLRHRPGRVPFLSRGEGRHAPAHRLLEGLAMGKGLREHRLRTLPSCPRDHSAGKRCVAGRHLRCRIRAEHRAGEPRPLPDVPGTRRRRRSLLPFASALSSLRGGSRDRRTAAAEDLRRRLLAYSPNGICTRARSTEVVKKAFDPRRVAPPH